MKSTIFLTILATAAGMPLVHANVMNRVTLSGYIHSVSAPVMRTTGNSSVSVSTILDTGVTNSTILDTLVQSGDIVDKRGYQLMQVLDDSGTALGYVAFNGRTGDTVNIPSTLIGNITGTVGIEADSSGTRTTRHGTTNIASTETVGIGTAVMFGTPTNVFVTENTALTSQTFRSRGTTNTVPFTAVDSHATFRGITLDNTVIDVSLSSKAGTVSND